MSHRTARLIDTAHSLDVGTLVATSDDWPVDRLPLDVSDPWRSAETIVNSRHRVDAVIPADTWGLMVASLASEGLGLPHNPPTAVAALANKAMMRRALQSAGVRQPSFEVATVADDTVALVEHLGTPAILKPLSLSNSTGLIEIDHPLGALQAEERIRRILSLHDRSPNEPILVERRIDGPEITLEGFLTEGRLETVAVFDGPTGSPDEVLSVTPSRLHPEILADVETLAEDSAAALGLLEGPIQVESRIVHGRAVAIQVTGVGGSFAACPSRDRLVLGRLLRMTIPEEPWPMSFGVLRVRTARPGVFQGIAGVELVEGLTAVTDLAVEIPIGTYVAPLPAASPHLLTICASGPSPEDVRGSLRAARSLLRLDII